MQILIPVKQGIWITVPHLGYAGKFHYLKDSESKHTNLQIVSSVSDLSCQAIDCFLFSSSFTLSLNFPPHLAFIYRFEFPRLVNLGCRIAPGFQT